MSSRKTDSGGDTAGKLSKLRTEIDKFDHQLLDIMNKRAAVAAQIGKVKADTGGEVFNAAREEEVLNAILKAHKGPLPEVTVKAIFRELISGSRALQSVQRVAFLGPDYSYSHLAAIERFGQSAEYSQVATIQAVFDEIVRKHANFGVVPLENSTDGRIADTLDCFVRNPSVKICAEIRMRVHHHLLANCQPAEVRRVYSKAQALSQCRQWLSKNMPFATTHPVNSTADEKNRRSPTTGDANWVTTIDPAATTSAATASARDLPNARGRSRRRHAATSDSSNAPSTRMIAICASPTKSRMIW